MQATATATHVNAARTSTPVDAFIDGVVDEYRRRLSLLSDSGDRRAVEDAMALLTDYRLSGMDEPAFERLLAMLRSGRSPVGLAVLKPQSVGEELARQWSARVNARN
jgi:hypothetical protein